MKKIKWAVAVQKKKQWRKINIKTKKRKWGCWKNKKKKKGSRYGGARWPVEGKGKEKERKREGGKGERIKKAEWGGAQREREEVGCVCG
ncbi:unnamed protein product [Camellia sinensis]